VNGFVYENQNAREFFEAVKRGLATWRNLDKRTEVMRNGMSRDATWVASAKEYETMYNDALAFRKSSVAVK
jgi:starch synthase